MHNPRPTRTGSERRSPETSLPKNENIQINTELADRSYRCGFSVLDSILFCPGSCPAGYSELSTLSRNIFH